MGGIRPAWRRPIGWSVGAGLLIAAAAVLAVTVRVEARGREAACGSAWDVVAGRAGWQQWWALDQADPVAGAPRLRTDGCVGAVNAHIVTASVLAAGAVAAFATAVLVGVRHRGARPGLGTTLTLLGVVLTVAAVVGLVLLVADPGAPLFLYVDRPVVVLLGLLLLLPAVVLIALGRVADLVAAQGRTDRSGDEPP